MFSPLRHAGAALWKRRPLQLTFFVTRRCNARCPFCFYLQGETSGRAARPELALEEVRRISASCGSLLWLAFSGGEPYLRKDLPAISRIFYEQNTPCVMLYPTNGSMPALIRDATERILIDCPRSVIVVKLSIDDVGAAHDALRKTPGAFDNVMATYRLLAPLLDRFPNFELGINTVFCAGNQHRMEEILAFVETLAHVRAHTISLVRGRLLDPRHGEVDYGLYRRAIERLEKNLKERIAGRYRFRGARTKTAQDIVQRRLILETALARRRTIACYAGRLNLVLSEDGEVYPCETLAQSLGNVRDFDYDLHRIMRMDAARAALDSIGAARCYCTHECYFITNILFNPRLYPALARQYLAL